MLKSMVLGMVALVVGYGYGVATEEKRDDLDALLDGDMQCSHRAPLYSFDSPVEAARALVYQEWRKKHYRDFRGSAYSSDVQCDEDGDYEQPTIEIRPDNNGGIEGELARQGLADVIEERTNN